MNKFRDIDKKQKIFSRLSPLDLRTISTGMGLAMLAAGFAEALFLMFVVALDILPFKYLLLLIIAFLIVDCLTLFLANGHKNRKTKSIAALVVVVLLLNILLMGDFYVYSTYDTLKKISAERDTWEYYDVMTSLDCPYESVSDIVGKEVAVVDMESKQLTEARERLVTKANVTYEEKNSIVTVAQTIYATADGDLTNKKSEDNSSQDSNTTETTVDAQSADEKTDGNSEESSDKSENIILLADSQRQVANSNIEGFKENTKILYKIKVKKRADDNSKRVDVTKDSFNILISGLDSWGTIDEDGLTDVNMIMTVNPVSREILLTSIPRDSYVPLHSYGAKDKLTHSAIYGQEETKQTIEDFLGIDINYSIRVNFSTFCDVIDAVGGVDVYNDIDFHSSVKGWHYKEGWLRDMYGHYALWFARERKSFTEGDMKRNENQQKVLAALLKKTTSSKVILTRYTSILDAIEDELQTDLTDSDMKRLVRMQLGDMQKWKIKKVNIVGSTGGAPCFSMGGQNLSCVFPNENSVEKAKKSIHDVMYPGENVNTEETTTPTNQ